MAYTVTQLNALQAAIATGALRMEYTQNGVSQSVVFRTQAEMLELETKMKGEIYPATRCAAPKRVYPTFRNGL